jgi:antitoxin YefM
MAGFRGQLGVILPFGSLPGICAGRFDRTTMKAYGINYSVEAKMTIISAREARARLYQLIDETAETHVPVKITGERHDAMLISAADWASIQETLHLLSVPGMRESIRAGMETPLDECDAELRW